MTWKFTHTFCKIEIFQKYGDALEISKDTDCYLQGWVIIWIM